jgi:hypothetical protein
MSSANTRRNRSAHGSRRARELVGQAERDAGEGGLVVEDVHRLPRGAQVVAGGAVAVATALEVAGEHHRVALAAVLEPRAGEAMREPLVVGGQGGVDALAEQRVAERQLALAGERLSGRTTSTSCSTSFASHAYTVVPAIAPPSSRTNSSPDGVVPWEM